MADAIPPPPAGYVLQAPGDDIPPPPSGYILQNSAPGEQPYNMSDPKPGSDVPGQVVMGASLFPGTQDKIKYMADKSGIPLNRFGVDKDGNIGYAGADGWHLVTPPISGGSLSKPLDLANRIGGQLAGNAGQAIPMAAGVVGGALGGVPGAAAAAAGGDAARQGIGKLMMPESTFDPWNVVGQGAAAGGGQLAGEMLGVGTNAVFGNNPLRLSAGDARRVQPNLPAYQRAAQAGADSGLSMTPADITGLRSARVMERQLYKNPEAQDALQGLYDRRNTIEFPSALNAVGDATAQPQSSILGARDLQNGAQQVLATLRAQRSAAASPHYVNAFQSGVVPDIQPVLDAITNAMPGTAQSSASRRVLDTAYHDLTGTQTVQVGGRPQQVRTPITNYEQMHSAKEAIDSELDALEQRGFNQSEINKARAALTPIQQQLTRTLRAAHPEYDAGYNAYIAASPPVDQAVNGLVGMMADQGRNAANVPGLLRMSKSPDVGAARRLFEQTGQLPAWNSGVRALLDQAGDTAMETTQSGQVVNSPGKFQKIVAGSPDRAAALETAVGGGPQQRAVAATLGLPYTPAPAEARLGNLLRTSRSVAGTLAEGSSTSADSAAANRFSSPIAKMTGRMFHGLDPFEIGPMIGDAIMHRSAMRNAEAIAQRYANSHPMQILGDLANTYMPLSARGVRGLGLLGQVGERIASRGLLVGQPTYQVPPWVSGAP